jgi:hypothetical protein
MQSFNTTITQPCNLGSKNLEQAATELDRAINKALKKACPEIKIIIGKHTPKDPDWFQPPDRKTDFYLIGILEIKVDST